MIHSLLLTVVAASAIGLSSCAQTGDPGQGGFFGWNQGMADDRIAAREAHLRDLENKNAYQRGRSSALRDQERRARSSY